MQTETTKKRPIKPFTGIEGKTFTSTNQPSPKAKKAGWEQWRKERRLTQEIIKQIGKGETLRAYAKSIIDLAKSGNTKAIDTVNQSLEDNIIKFAQTDSEGKDIVLNFFSISKQEALWKLNNK